MAHRDDVAKSWDEEYRLGRYVDESPVDFVIDIIDAARSTGLNQARGVYVGCGNGRNYLPLVRSGLDLIGLDVSEVAIRQLAARVPDQRHRLICGDLSALPDGRRYGIVVAIQVLQHGNRNQAHAHVRALQDRVSPGGIVCIRVNAAQTDIVLDHDVVERVGDGSLTVRYRAGPKRGLSVHFFAADELAALFADRFSPIAALRTHTTWRDDVPRTQWTQWEAIWQRTVDQT